MLRQVTRTPRPRHDPEARRGRRSEVRRVAALVVLPLCLLALSVAPLGHLPSDHQRWQMVVTTGVPPGLQPHGMTADTGRQAHSRCLGCAVGVGWSALLAAHPATLTCVPAGLPPDPTWQAATKSTLAEPSARGPPPTLPV